MTPEVQTLVDSRDITKPLVEVLFVGQWRLRKQWRVVISVRHMENSAKTSGFRSFRSDYWLMLARSLSAPGTAVWLLLQKSSSETRWNKHSSELCAMHPRNFSGCTRASCPVPKSARPILPCVHWSCQSLHDSAENRLSRPCEEHRLWGGGSKLSHGDIHGCGPKWKT